MLASMENRVRRWLYGRDLAVWYAPEYRWPLSALEARTGFQARRADFALWFLLERRALPRGNPRPPRRAGDDDPARGPTPGVLDSPGGGGAAGPNLRGGPPPAAGPAREEQRGP